MSGSSTKTKVGDPSSAPVEKDPAPQSDKDKGQETQFTQYSVSHNQSAGFAKAKALAEQSKKGDGVGRLLKKRSCLILCLGMVVWERYTKPGIFEKLKRKILTLT
jgi:hypothetical protein